jgi:muramidase (phage lysozyme)
LENYFLAQTDEGRNRALHKMARALPLTPGQTLLAFGYLGEQLSGQRGNSGTQKLGDLAERLASGVVQATQAVALKAAAGSDVWVGNEDRGLQGRLVPVGTGSHRPFWLQGPGHAYLLTDSYGRPITDEDKARARAFQLIQHGAATLLYPLEGRPPESPRSPEANPPSESGQAVADRRGSSPSLATASRNADKVTALHPGIRLVSNGRQGYAITPERRALLNTIRYAEGTWKGGDDIGYRVKFGGSLARNLDRHPREVHKTARYESNATGAYQFLSRTWDGVAAKLGLTDFGPDSQDQAALRLIQDRGGALTKFDKQGLTREVLARLAPEWASLPTLGGGSYYGQPVKSARELQNFFNKELARLRRLSGPTA